MEDVKNLHESVLCLPVHPGEGVIHKQLGMRITASGKGVTYPPMRRPEPRYFEFYSLSHLIEGEGFLWTPHQGERLLRPGDAVLMGPGQVHSYGGKGSSFTEDYICFVGNVVDGLAQAGALESGLRSLGRERRILPLIDAAQDLSDLGQMKANALLHRFLVDLHEEGFSGWDGTSHRIDRLLKRLHSQPGVGWTLSMMAQSCNLGEAQFRRVFRERTGRNPKAYLEELRIRAAGELLASSDASLDEIARRMGYADRFHFSKTFKRLRSMAPRDYRRAYWPGGRG
ncbi:MAG: AraC family transcriptional regulator [Spirochaetales bacterium]|nr:AraC family transcriptional regulator [Spirochaetales bacterium]